MRITDLEATIVNVPLKVPFAASFRRRTCTTRIIVQLKTDQGLTGLGETMGGSVQLDLLNRMKPSLVGCDPLDRTRLLEPFRMLPFFHGYAGYNVISAVEVACWDLLGKVSQLPLYRLLGGAGSTRVPIVALITRGTVDQPDPVRVAEAAAEIVGRGGFQAVKFKGSTNARDDVLYLAALRDALGPDMPLRIDPNAHWSVQDTLQVGPRLEDIGLEYLEDPCEGLEGMAQVRRVVRLPLCTNMCCVRVEEIAPAVRMGAVNVIHGDVSKWGGIEANRKLAACCEAFGLGMNLHSGGELGIGTACHLHLAAATPQIRYAIDSMYDLLSDDVIEGPMLEFADGALVLPDGPGLGVRLDNDKLREFHALYLQEGESLV